MSNVNSTGQVITRASPPPEPVESKLLKMYVGEWAKNHKKTDDSMQALEDVNTKLGRLNSLLAKLGKLLAQVGESGDAKKLVDALNKDPDLIYEINRDIRDVALPEPPFRNSVGDAYNHTLKVTDPNFAYLLGAQVVKDFGLKNFDRLRAIALLWEPPIAINDASASKVSELTWSVLGYEFFGGVPNGTTKLDVPPLDPQSKPSFNELKREFALRFNDAHASSRVQGGLNRSHTGADLYGAVQIVKAEHANLSNHLQSDASRVNQSMQVTTAIMSAITDMIQKMFDTKSKALN